MSSAAIDFPAVRARAEAETADEKLLRSARELLRGGPVCFKISTRVPAELLARWRRGLYVAACRSVRDPRDPLPSASPPAPAMQLTVFTAWDGGLAECKTPDDQLLVMPLNRSYSRDRLDVAVECRPRDPADATRYEILCSVFGSYVGGRGGDAPISVDDLKRITSDLTDIRRMTEPRL